MKIIIINIRRSIIICHLLYMRLTQVISYSTKPSKMGIVVIPILQIRGLKLEHIKDFAHVHQAAGGEVAVYL